MANLLKERASYLALNALELAKVSVRLFNASDLGDLGAMRHELDNVLASMSTIETIRFRMSDELRAVRDEHARREAGTVPPHDG